MTVPHSQIDICDEEQIAELRTALHGLSERDPGQFAAQAREFFLACGVPALPPQSSSTTTVSSFINGVPLYSIKNTTTAEYQSIFDAAKTAGELWNKMPLSARQEFFRVMAHKIGAKYKPAIDLAITLEVGKAGSEFAKTTRWDEWCASPEVRRYLSNIFIKDDIGRKYYLNQTDHIPGSAQQLYFYQGVQARGLGVVGSTNGFNYPAALAIPDVVASRVSGNGFIGKVPSKAPSFLYIRRKSEEEALDYMAGRMDRYSWAARALRRGVDLTDQDTMATLKRGFGIISGREIIGPWATSCAVLRVVGGKSAGQVFKTYRQKVDPELKTTILELAGNNPVVIMPSATNLDGGLSRVVRELATGNKDNSGQRCTSPRRWFVHQDIYDDVRALAVEHYSASLHNKDGAIGNPLDENTKIGAMDKGGFDAAMDYLARARAAGAEIIGGERLFAEKFPDAWYMTPALVIWDHLPENAKQLMHAEEIFAPIANLDKIHTLDEAIKKTNLSRECLSGAFYCDKANIEELSRFAQKTNLGSLIHNSPPKDLSPDGIHAGRDEGGIGITGSLKSLDQYTSRRPNNDVRLLAKVDDIDAAKRLADSLLSTR
jgi:aldehyde dehydrogenase (NAD+)